MTVVTGSGIVVVVTKEVVCEAGSEVTSVTQLSSVVVAGIAVVTG